MFGAVRRGGGGGGSEERGDRWIKMLVVLENLKLGVVGRNSSSGCSSLVVVVCVLFGKFFFQSIFSFEVLYSSMRVLHQSLPHECRIRCHLIVTVGVL